MMEQQARTMTDEQRQLVEDNMRLVPFMLKKFDVPYWNMISDEEDLIQTGYLALCMAAMSYDSGCGKFSTYACNAIKNAILKTIQKESDMPELSIEDEAVLSYLSEPDPNTIEGTYETRVFLEKAVEQKRSRAETRNIQMMFACMDGYSTRELAQAHGLKLITVQRSIKSARQLIRMEYQQFEGRLMRA